MDIFVLTYQKQGMTPEGLRWDKEVLGVYSDLEKAQVEAIYKLNPDFEVFWDADYDHDKCDYPIYISFLMDKVKSEGPDYYAGVVGWYIERFRLS